MEARTWVLGPTHCVRFVVYVAAVCDTSVLGIGIGSIRKLWYRSHPSVYVCLPCY